MCTMCPGLCQTGRAVGGSQGLLLGFYMMGEVEVVGLCVVPGVSQFECLHIRVRGPCLCSLTSMCSRWQRGRLS